MAEKPTTAKEYSSDQSKLVRATCLYVATILGDYMEDIVIVGGLVPSFVSLLIFAVRHIIELEIG